MILNSHFYVGSIQANVNTARLHITSHACLVQATSHGIYQYLWSWPFYFTIVYDAKQRAYCVCPHVWWPALCFCFVFSLKMKIKTKHTTPYGMNQRTERILRFTLALVLFMSLLLKITVVCIDFAWTLSNHISEENIISTMLSILTSKFTPYGQQS